MYILMYNKLNHPCVTEVSNTGKIENCRTLPEWVEPFVDKVTDYSIIEWFNNRKDKLNPEFIFKQKEEKGKLFLEIEIGGTSIRVRETGVEVKGKVDFFRFESLKRSIELAQDYAAILHYDYKSVRRGEV